MVCRFQYMLRCRRPISGSKCRLFLATLCKHDVVHKTGSTSHIASPPENDRATVIVNMHWKFCEDWARGCRGLCADIHARPSQYSASLLRNAQFTPPARHNKTVLSLSCLMCRCKLDECAKRVQSSSFLSATVLSCREYNSHRRTGRDTDKTVLSCLAWRCELAMTPPVKGP